MGNAQVMTAKAAWDNACYWAVTGVLFFQRRFVDLAFMRSIDSLMKRFFVLHARMQVFSGSGTSGTASRYRAGLCRCDSRPGTASAPGRPRRAENG